VALTQVIADHCELGRNFRLHIEGAKMRGCGRQSGRQHLEYLSVKAVWIKTG
jgi:hypothetical protein